ncbi:MAG TPA: hypothetical protein VEU30_01690 [Thermoanaerobaculia bacterium]|nr:hypothetical protein [Thermoanaerobaculia bacterium]
MARRLAAMFGLVIVLALALTLLYRVYLHHTQAEPYVGDDGPTVVRLHPDWTGARAGA